MKTREKVPERATSTVPVSRAIAAHRSPSRRRRSPTLERSDMCCIKHGHTKISGSNFNINFVDPVGRQAKTRCCNEM